MPCIETKLLITGASGRYGRLLIRDLMESRIDPSNLLLLTRDPTKLANYAQLGCTIREGSFDDPKDRLTAAFHGAETIFMISTSRAGARLPQHLNAVQSAVAAGAKRIVYTSFVSAHFESPTALVAQEHHATEKMLRDSGLDWTVLRDSMYMEALSEVILPTALLEGILRSNVGSGKVAFVSREDCVKAAAAILRDPKRHQNVAYDITGPQLLTWENVAEVAASITSQPLSWHSMTDEECFRMFDDMGVPRHPSDDFERDGVKGYHWNSTDMVSCGSAIRNNELEVITDHVHKLTKCQPRTIEDVFRSTYR